MAKEQRASPQLAILGSWPPPAGGVSIHTQRLCGLLDQRGLNYVVYNATSDVGDGSKVIGVYSRRRSWLLRYLFAGREPAVYLFSGRLSAWLIGALLARLRGKRVMLRLRNSALIDWSARSRWRRNLCSWALRQMNAVVCVNRHLLEAAQALGVDRQRLHWSPGFLPPRTDEFDRSQVASHVWNFIENRDPLIVANGKVNWYQGVDLYGLDMLVQLAARLRLEFPNLGIVVCFWDHHAAENQRLDELRSRARDLGVEDLILFNTQPGPLMPVLAVGDVFVRPTATDGDANSIREALYLNVPAVASDVVERPAGTVLFPNRDIEAFEARVREALAINKKSAESAPRLNDADRRRIDAYVELIAAFASGERVPQAQPNGA